MAAEPQARPSDAPQSPDLRPTYAEIDKGAMAANLRTIARHVGAQTRVLAVVKADGYGHGALEAARVFSEAGAWGLAVSLVEEGMRLRDGAVHAPIVVLGGVAPGSADIIVHRQLRPVVWETDHLELLRAAVRRSGAKPARVYLKVDTGMSRLGAIPERLPPLLEWLRADRGQTVELEGTMTHLASADELSDELTSARQLARFEQSLAMFGEYGLDPGLRHASNSAGLVRFPQAHYDMVRPGIALYGAASCVEAQLPGLREAMAVRSRILALRELPQGVRVSYGGRDQLKRDSTLAIVPVGYAVGYPRSLSGKAHVLVRGHACKVVGAVTMDVSMVDVTDLPGVRPGEEVTLLGPQGQRSIGVHQLSAWSGLVPYEVTCGVSKRVPRRYVGGDGSAQRS